MRDTTKIIRGLRAKASFIQALGSYLRRFDYDSGEKRNGGDWKNVSYISIDDWTPCTSVTFDVHGPDAPQLMAGLRHEIGGEWKKSTDDYYMRLKRTCVVGNTELRVTIQASRAAVCEKVVVGTKTIVTEAIPASVREEEIVEWVCASILAEAVAK